MPRPAPIVGFDLDLTLVDSAAGILVTYQAVLAEAGVAVPDSAVLDRIGVDLSEVFTQLAPGLDPVAAAARYRELYPDLGIASIMLLPGAREAVAAVRQRGGQVHVVSTKVEPAVRLVLDHVALDVDAIAGGRFGVTKGRYLRRVGALAYVGDHPADVLAAQVAGARSIAVATGPHPAEVLARSGADVVLPDLHAFPAALDGVLGKRPGTPPVPPG